MIKENIKNCSFFIRKEFAKAREDFMDYEDCLREEEKNDPINNRMVAVYTRKRNFAEWQMRYSFPEIILLVGDSQLTKAVVEHIKESEGFDYFHMTMAQLVANGNQQLPTPKGDNGGILFIDYESGLTNRIFDFVSGIVMKKNDEEESIFQGMSVWQNIMNIHDERSHIDDLLPMPYVTTGWKIVLIAQENCYQDFSYKNQQYMRELDNKEKWKEIMVVEDDSKTVPTTRPVVHT